MTADRPAKPGLADALAAFQLELPKIGKDKQADAGKFGYKYADLASVSAAVLPLLGKHGLSFSAKPTLDDGGRFVLAYTLRHVSGESDSGIYPLPAANTAAQQLGSAITYARRYCLLAVTGVMPEDEDDDGAQAPAASMRPVERHESSWDPEEQQALRDGYEAEIAAATAEQIPEIAQRLLAAKRSGTLSPNTYQHLAIAGGRRKGELDAAAKQDAEPATVPATTDGSPSRRQQQLAAMSRKVEQRKEADSAQQLPAVSS